MKFISKGSRLIAGVALAGLFSLMISGAASAEGITKEQGDAIINELRQIRQLLTRPQNPEPAQAPQAPQKVRIKLRKEESSLGRSDAPLVMMEYTDYQCPFCNRFYTSTFPEIKREYIDTGKMLFITRDFPLEFHQQSMRAAQATHCAAEQGKFWQMKDSLMNNFSRLSPELIDTLARERLLDMDTFKACMDSGRYKGEIDQEIAAAKAVGISGTPSFIIGKVSGGYLDGYLVVGAQPFSNFDAVAKKVLSESK